MPRRMPEILQKPQNMYCLNSIFPSCCCTIFLFPFYSTVQEFSVPASLLPLLPFSLKSLPFWISSSPLYWNDIWWGHQQIPHCQMWWSSSAFFPIEVDFPFAILYRSLPSVYLQLWHLPWPPDSCLQLPPWCVIWIKVIPNLVCPKLTSHPFPFLASNCFPSIPHFSTWCCHLTQMFRPKSL